MAFAPRSLFCPERERENPGDFPVLSELTRRSLPGVLPQMFSVKYKFPAWKDEETKTVHFDGASISVAEMRLVVAQQTQCDPMDLYFKDHATNERTYGGHCPTGPEGVLTGRKAKSRAATWRPASYTSVLHSTPHDTC